MVGGPGWSTIATTLGNQDAYIILDLLCLRITYGITAASAISGWVSNKASNSAGATYRNQPIQKPPIRLSDILSNH